MNTAEVGQIEWFPDELPNPVVRVAADGEVLYANRASGPLLSAWKVRPGERLPEDPAALAREALATGRVTETEVAAADRIFMVLFTPLVKAALVHIYGVDISERKRFEEMLLHRSGHDAITGLPNRSLLLDRLAQSIQRAERDASMTAVLLLDLDHFNDVNEKFGHDAGDAVLRRVAQRLRACVGAGDTIARFAGDEFACIIDRTDSCRVVAEAAGRVMSAVARPVAVAGQRVHLSASMGISVFPLDGKVTEDVLRHADLALHRAKAEGPNMYRFYATRMGADAAGRQTMLDELRQALSRGELVLYYQPQVELRSSRIVGAEALVRSLDAAQKAFAPGDLIRLAEERGLISRIGEWVLRTACAQTKAWQDLGLPGLRVAVNVSAVQFRQPELTALVRNVLSDTGLAPRFLELEITEGINLHDAEATIQVLQALHALGIELSIDDFGTGYSSLSYLKRFPVQEIKIDQSFVHDIHTDTHNAAICEAVVNLAHRLQMRVIAEGVEREEELRCLQRMGCDEAQGYYFSRPLPAEEIVRLLNRGGALPAI
jgi:diguanylate cyclase (GGDEF)-like protein